MVPSVVPTSKSGARSLIASVTIPSNVCVRRARRARWEHSIFLTAPRPARRPTAAAILCFRPLFTLRRQPSGGKIPLENQIITAALEHTGKPGAKARCPVCHFCRLRQPERRSHCNRPDRGLHHRSSVAAASQPRVEMLSQRQPRRCTRVQTRQAPLILSLAIRQCGHRSPVSSANAGRFASDGRLEQARMPVAATLSSFGISRDSCRNSWLPR